MLLVYFGFIGLIAFDKASARREDRRRHRLPRAVLGVTVILFAFILTGIYVQRANGRFDELTAALKRRRRPMIRLKHPLVLDARHDRGRTRRPTPPVPTSARSSKSATNWPAIGMFAFFVLLTLGITYKAAKGTKSAADFYAAGGGISAGTNSLAIAGDYMSAASFLGISGLVYTSGFDGLIYSTGFLVGWPIVLFLIAERLRNLGKFTFADVASFRLDQTSIRIISAVGTLVVVAFYLIAQMVGAGKLIQLLFGLPYLYAVIIVGVLMIVYVAFGGMKATTWVQVIKACLLLGGATFMAGAVLLQVRLQPRGPVRRRRRQAHPKGDAIMAPGGLVSNPVEAISLGVGLMFGTAGLPHILMRFFTVSDAQAARKSVFYATGLIGYFYILTFIIGFGGIALLMSDPSYFKLGPAGAFDKLKGMIGGTNMVAVNLANAVGGPYFLGFISAVAFATILAVVAGLTLAGASAVSHDLYAQVIARGRTNEAAEVRLSKIAAVGHRHRGDLPRLRLREPERRLHGRSGLRGRGELQLPGPDHVDPVEGHHHLGRPHRRPRRPASRRSAWWCCRRRSGWRPSATRCRSSPTTTRPCSRCRWPSRRSGSCLEARHVPAGPARAGRLRGAIRALGDRHRRRRRARALSRPDPSERPGRARREPRPSSLRTAR